MKIRTIIIIVTVLWMSIMTVAYKVHKLEQSELKHKNHVEAMITFERFVRDSL